MYHEIRAMISQLSAPEVVSKLVEEWTSDELSKEEGIQAWVNKIILHQKVKNI